MPRRKVVPKDIDRALYLEASGHCAFPRCRHELGLERHHIDGNCNNNNLENLLLLCPTHHQWATMGKIDQKTCRKIKSRLLAEYIISYAPRKTTISLPTRRRFNDVVINAIESDPKLLRAIIIGPHFLHPQWVIQRRLERESRKSFSLALRTYIERSLHRDDRDIRLILRNNLRYIQILKPLVHKNEVSALINEMRSTLHTIFSSRSYPINFCCKEDTGFYHGVLITDNSCFVASRETSESQINSGYELKDPDVIEMELVRFDRIFDANFRGQDAEIKSLEKFITSLKHLI